MEFFDTFPFTKLQGKNRGLDWVIQKIVSFQKEIDKIPEYVDEYVSEYNPEESKHIKSRNNPHEVTAEQVGARPNTWMPTAEEVGARPNTWMPTAEEVGAANFADVKKAAPRNLLDNSNFRIAQSGYGGRHGGELYVADRWTTEATELDIVKSANRIDISVVSGTPAIMQRCTDEIAEYLIGKTVTIALKDGSGNIRIASGLVTYEEMCVAVFGEDFTFGISLYPTSKQLMRIVVNSGCTASIQWVALYEGEYTAETLPEYKPKGYNEELSECQRYYIADCLRGIPGYVLTGGMQFIGTIKNCSMRMDADKPTVELITPDSVVIDGDAVAVTGVNSITKVGNGFQIALILAKTMEKFDVAITANVVGNLNADL